MPVSQLWRSLFNVPNRTWLEEAFCRVLRCS